MGNSLLLARVNYYGVKVLISLRGVAPQLLVGKHRPSGSLSKKVRSMATSSAIPTSRSIGTPAGVETRRLAKPGT